MIVKNENVNLEKLDDKVCRKILGCDGSLMMVEVRFEKGGIGEIHSHEHEQVSYIVEGSFEVTVGEEKEVLKTGDSFYVEANVDHGVKALEDAVILDVFTPIREGFLE